VTLPYGFIKARITSDPVLKPTHRRHETQYHLHFSMTVGQVPWDDTLNGSRWDVAVNVGTSDADDLLKFKLVYDFRHPIIEMLGAAADGAARDLTGAASLPALDFARSDLLVNTGRWRDSDIMDGSDVVEPVASLKRLLLNARHNGFNVYVFGRFFDDRHPRNGGQNHPQGHSPMVGIHDAHMNQGSTGDFIHQPGDDHNDHNDVWQDGGLFVDVGQPEWAAYFAAFDQQLVPTDKLGNPTPDAKPI
jgi:uncharacterized protein YukJ